MIAQKYTGDMVLLSSMVLHSPGMEKTGKRTPERAITYLMQDEARRLFGPVKDKRDYALFRLAYEHGLRASEVGLLQRDDVGSHP